MKEAPKGFHHYCHDANYANFVTECWDNYPDSKVHGANMGPIWGRQDPGGTHVGPMNFAIWVQSVIPPMATKLALWQRFGICSQCEHDPNTSQL